MNHQADDAAVDEAQATMAAHLVLFSPDLWAQQLWQWLDRCSKRALRATSVAMREQVDGAIVFVASPEERRLYNRELKRALVLWPGVRDLALNACTASIDVLQPLTTMLAGLTSLVIREVGSHGAWRMAHAMHGPSTVAACMEGAHPFPSLAFHSTEHTRA
jgi:orotidine-5'-phosphate decarboxylase